MADLDNLTQRQREIYRFIRDTTWVSVRWYQPGGPLTAEQVGRQYLAIVLGGITADNIEGV